MKESFQKLYNDLKLSRAKCPWSSEQTLVKHIPELKKEILEVEEAIKNNDPINLKEELGDVFMDAFFLMVIAEEQGIMPKEVIQNVNEKLVRRKPWVFGDLKIKDKEEAIKVWNQIKQKEKEHKK